MSQTIFSKVRRKYESTESTLQTRLVANQWGLAEDTNRLVAKKSDGTTAVFYWDAEALACFDDSCSQSPGAFLIGVDGITGITPTGGSVGVGSNLQAVLEGMANQIGSGIGTNYWGLNGNDIYALFAESPTNGNVGIGSSDPKYKLDVDGNIGINSGIYNLVDNTDFFGFGGSNRFSVILSDEYAVDIQHSTKEVVVNYLQEGFDFRVPAGSAGIGITNLFFIDVSNGSVGINSTAHVFDLDVNGNIGINSGIYNLLDNNDFFGFGGSNRFSVILSNEYAIDIQNSPKEVGINYLREGFDFRIKGGSAGIGVSNLLLADVSGETVGIKTETQPYDFNVFGNMGIFFGIYNMFDANDHIGFGSGNDFEIVLNGIISDDWDLGATQKIYTFNPDLNDIDYLIKTRYNAFTNPYGATTFFIRSSDGRIGINTNDPSTLSSFYVWSNEDNFVRSTLFIENTRATGINAEARLNLRSRSNQASSAVVFFDYDAGFNQYYIQKNENAGGKFAITYSATSAVNDATLALCIDQNNPPNVGIGTTIPHSRLTSNGNLTPGLDNNYDCGTASYRWDDIYATNSTIQTSDKNDKTEIIETDLGLDFVMKLKPRSFKWKTDSTKIKSIENNETIKEKEEILQKLKHTRKHYGFIAQEVEESLRKKDFAGLVKDKESGKYGLRYTEFLAPIVKAIQELKNEIEEIKKKL